MAKFSMELPTEIMKDFEKVYENSEKIFGGMTRAGAEVVYSNIRTNSMIRALVQPFDFLMVDEPISHLDDVNSAIMCEIMMEEVRRQGAGVIVTSIGKHMNMSYDKTYRL